MAEADQPQVWARRILSSAGPLRAAVARPTVSIDSPMDADVRALEEGFLRVEELLATPTPEINHDLLNLIGAVRGYAEMLFEEQPRLHPVLSYTLPALLAAVGCNQAALDLPSVEGLAASGR